MKQQQLSGANKARISELGFPHIHMAYVYSDLNTFSAGVRAGTKSIFCRCPRVDRNVFLC